MVALVIYNTSEATCDCKCEITEQKTMDLHIAG